MQKGNLTFFYPKAYTERVEHFYSFYDLELCLFPTGSNRTLLKPAMERQCRFCGSHGSTEFKSDAHFFPKAIGNQAYLSDFECDICNHYFGSTYERDLANFLGLGRSISQAGAHGKVANFQSADGYLKANPVSGYNQPALLINRDTVDNAAITMDKTTGRAEIKALKKPYSLLSVYKALYKMALSMVTENDQPFYKQGKQFLLTKNHERFNGLFVNGYQLPLAICMPVHAYLFRKRNPKDKLHSHVFVIYFQNHIISVPLIFHGDDHSFYGQEISMPLYPPLFVQYRNCDNIQLNGFYVDMSSPEKITSDEEVIIMQINQEELKNAVKLDPLTQTITASSFNPGEIMQLVVGGAGGKLIRKAKK
jgi:hypothetical protein